MSLMIDNELQFKGRNMKILLLLALLALTCVHVYGEPPPTTLEGQLARQRAATGVTTVRITPRFGLPPLNAPQHYDAYGRQIEQPSGQYDVQIKGDPNAARFINLTPQERLNW